MDLILNITRTTVVEPRYKYQRCRKVYASHQNLLHHYQHSKINLIYLFNLEIQQILETHDLNRHTHF